MALVMLKTRTAPAVNFISHLFLQLPGSSAAYEATFSVFGKSNTPLKNTRFYHLSFVTLSDKQSLNEIA
jgi:hypothetical protein